MPRRLESRVQPETCQSYSLIPVSGQQHQPFWSDTCTHRVYAPESRLTRLPAIVIARELAPRATRAWAGEYSSSLDITEPNIRLISSSALTLTQQQSQKRSYRYTLFPPLTSSFGKLMLTRLCCRLQRTSGLMPHCQTTRSCLISVREQKSSPPSLSSVSKLPTTRGQTLSPPWYYGASPHRDRLTFSCPSASTIPHSWQMSQQSRSKPPCRLTADLAPHRASRFLRWGVCVPHGRQWSACAPLAGDFEAQHCARTRHISVAVTAALSNATYEDLALIYRYFSSASHIHPNGCSPPLLHWLSTFSLRDRLTIGPYQSTAKGRGYIYAAGFFFTSSRLCTLPQGGSISWQRRGLALPFGSLLSSCSGPVLSCMGGRWLMGRNGKDFVQHLVRCWRLPQQAVEAPGGCVRCLSSASSMHPGNRSSSNSKLMLTALARRIKRWQSEESWRQQPRHSVHTLSERHP